MIKRIPIILALLLAWSASAATYYIDWVSGDDTNAGTETNAPWKRHPDMNGWLGGSFTAQPGDRFILKGGVTWPNEACTLYIQDDGTAENRIYVGIDTNWYSGDQWITWTNGNGVLKTNFNYPTLDAQGIQISDSRTFINIASTRNNVVIVNGDYITLEGLKIKGVLINDNPAGGSNNPDAGTDHTLRVYNATSFRGIGLYLCDWVVETTLGGDVGGAIMSGTSTDGRLIDSRIKGPENIDPQWITAADGRDYGNAVQHFTRVQGCDISFVGQGIWNCSVVESNIIHTMGKYTDAGAHENALWAQNSTLFRNNVVRDVSGVLYFLVGYGSRSPHRQWVYNNLFFNTPQINLTPQSNPDEQNEIWFFNNVVKQPAGAVIQVGTVKAGEPFGTLVIQNNVFISGTRPDGDEGMVAILDSNDLGSQYTNSHNVYWNLSTATAQNIIEANLWEPQSEVAALVDQGIDGSNHHFTNTASIFYSVPTNDFAGVERPQGAEWDIGAYEFVSESGGTGSVFFSSATYTVSEAGGTVTNIITRAGGDTGAVSVDWETGDQTAVAGTDYTASSGTVSWADTETGNKEVVISVTSNETVDGDRTFTNRLFNATTGLTIIAPSVTTVTITDDDGTPPAAPSDLAGQRDGHKMALTWVDNANDEDNIIVERAQPDEYSVIATLDPNTTSYLDDGINSPQQIVPGVEVEYRWRVRADNIGGSSEYSNTITNIVTGVVGGQRGMKRVGPSSGASFKGL